MHEVEILERLAWRAVQEEDKQNVQLLDLSNQILDLTKAVHEYARAREAADGGPSS